MSDVIGRLYVERKTAFRSQTGFSPNPREFLLGYWIVDVATPERACAIAGRISAAPGPGGIPTNMPIEVRRFRSYEKA